MINYEQYLVPSTQDEELELIKSRFQLVGSRSIIPDFLLKPETDYDFIGEATVDNIRFLESNLFFNKTMNPGYMDIATTHVYTNFSHMIQVTLKSTEYWKSVQEMYTILSNNPDLYKKYLWKSYGGGAVTTQDQVRKRIELLLQFIRISNITPV